MNSSNVPTPAAAPLGAPVLPSLPLSAPVDWEKLRAPFARGWAWTYDPASAFACAFHVAGQLLAYSDPVPAGRLSVIERDTVAIQRGHVWAGKIAAGGSSCAWHEISEHFKTVCPCCKCVDARKACRAVKS